MTKIQTYLNINCNEFNGAHVLWEIPSLKVSTTTAEKKITLNHLWENLKYVMVWLFPGMMDTFMPALVVTSNIS